MFSKLNQVCVVLCAITVAVYAAQEEGERTSTLSKEGMMSAQEAQEMMERLENKTKAKATGTFDFKKAATRGRKTRRVNNDAEKELRNKISDSKRGKSDMPNFAQLKTHFKTLKSDCILTQYAREDERKLANAVRKMRSVVKDDKEIVSDNATPEQILERLTCIDFACTHCREKRTAFQKSLLYSANFPTPLNAIDYFIKTLSDNKGTVWDTKHLISLCIEYYTSLKPKQLKNLLEVADKLQTEGGEEEEQIPQLMEWVKSNIEGVITPIQASCLPETIVFPTYLFKKHEHRCAETFHRIADEKDMIYDTEDTTDKTTFISKIGVTLMERSMRDNTWNEY